MDGSDASRADVEKGAGLRLSKIILSAASTLSQRIVLRGEVREIMLVTEMVWVVIEREVHR